MSANAEPSDWPSWRGPQQNGISAETGLIDRFDPQGGPGSNVLWKSDVAAGISTPIVMHGRVFTIVRDRPGTPQDAEKVIALDATTGELLWQNVYNVFLSDLPAERVGWSNVCGDPATDRVYALGACCYFQCIDATSGATVWARSLSEEFGMLSTYGGRTNTPVLFENLVIISGVTTGWDTTARPAHRFFAFDKTDGRLVWSASTRPLPEDTTYSTPVVKRIAGQDVLVAGSGDGGVYGFQPLTGKILWQEPISRRGINTSPAIDDEGNVYVTHGEENPQGTAMGAVVRIDAAEASLDSVSAERWRSEEIMAGKSSPLLLGDRLYVVTDSAKLQILDRHSGDELGTPLKLGTAMRGSLLYADGKIYAATSQGIVHVLKPTDTGVESVFKVRLPRGHDVGGSPIVAHGRIYLPTTGGLFCLGHEQASPAQASIPSGPTNVDAVDTGRQAVPSNSVVAQLQLVPAEAILRPGNALDFQVAAFDAAGARVPTPANLIFAVDGGGQIDAAGRFTPADSSEHQAATVSVRYEGLSSSSRLRIIPDFPWRFDFSAGQVPITWVGARYRHEAREVDGDPAIVKITTIPKGTRSQTWFGPTHHRNYTITTDVKAQAGTAKLPDMGVIAQRYTLDLMGESQQLQIRTWAAQLRMARSVPYEWKADVWYTLKLQASLEDGVAILKGKVWPRGEAEPSQWNVTATDDAANEEGSPGLFGNATNAEIYIDNVAVTSNE